MRFPDDMALVMDFGLFPSLALLLAKDFGDVGYFCPWETTFADGRELMVGMGLPPIRRVKNWDAEVNDADLLVFPDVLCSDLQEYYRKQGKRVWGAGSGAELELLRWKAKQLNQAAGLPWNECYKITGTKALGEFFIEHPSEDGWYVKISGLRGLGETWFARDYSEARGQIDELNHKHAPLSYVVEFIVEASIPDADEIGYDGFNVGGEFPNSSLWGQEKKDKCFDSETEILTEHGWKLFQNLSEGERVLTLNNSNRRHPFLEYQLPTHFMVADYSGDMFKIQNQNVDLLVTPEHDLWIQEDFQNKETGKLVTWTDKRGNTRTFYQGKRMRNFVKPKDLDLLKPFSMPFPNPTCANTTGATMKIGSTSLSMRQFSVLMGLYLSEGHVQHKKGQRCFYTTIAQFKYCAAFESLLKKLPFGFKKCNCGFSSTNRELGNYLLQFGKSRDKFVPMEIKMSGRGNISAFLDAYCLGDGSFIRVEKLSRGKRGERISRRYTTISKSMADDLQEIIVKIGNPAAIATKLRKGVIFYVITERPIQKKNIVFPKHCSWVKYSGKIFCVSVPNRIIMVRRNRKPIWSGNCYFGTVADYADLPEGVRTVNDALSGIIKEHYPDYRQFISTEIREKDGKPHPIDYTARHASPAGECVAANMANLAEVIWFGAEGKLVQPEWRHKFCAQIILCSETATERSMIVDFPEDDREWVKLYNWCRVDDQGELGMRDWFIRQVAPMKQLGSVIALGDDPEETIALCKRRADDVRGFDLESEGDCLDEVAETVMELI